MPLTLQVAAIHLLSSHSNGISALQLQAQLGLRSYKAAWLLLHKLRRAMVDPNRTALADLVEVDESELPYRTKEDPPAGGQGRSHIGKLLVIGAVELSDDGKPRRIRLDRLSDFSAASITGFISRVVAPGATIVSDGLPSYLSLKEHKHHRKVVGSMAAHIVLPWVHRVFANLKRWGLGTFHGLREAHLQRYLDEFVFRWNRRRHTRAFDTLAGLTMRLTHASYRDFVALVSAGRSAVAAPPTTASAQVAHTAGHAKPPNRPPAPAGSASVRPMLAGFVNTTSGPHPVSPDPKG